MKKYTQQLILLILLLLAACSNASSDETPSPTSTPESDALEPVEQATDSAYPISTEQESDSAYPVSAEQTIDSANPDSLETWLGQLQRGEIEAVKMGERLDWAAGYFLYYGTIEGLGMDNLIYNALRAYRRLETEEVTTATQSPGDKNLMLIADTLDYSPDGALTDQLGQSDAIRAAILEHVVTNQSDLSPEEALASGNIAGMIASPAPESLGEKFLVFGQDTPGAEFQFVGIVMMIDATASANVGDVYSHDEWNELRWLGDAAGPFWEDLPIGTSDDPSNVAVARPGVLLVNEAVYNEIVSGE